MKLIVKFSFILSILMICMNVTSQNRDDDILSDSAKFAEYSKTCIVMDLLLMAANNNKSFNSLGNNQQMINKR